MITTVLLIAPLNFATQLQVTKHSTMPYLAVSDSEHVKAWRKPFP